MIMEPCKIRESQTRTNKASTLSQSPSISSLGWRKPNWSREKDDKLVRLEMEGEDWVAISNTIPRRSSKDCYSW